MKGFVIMNAYPAGEKFYRQSERLVAALRAKGVEVALVKNGGLPWSIRKNGEICFDGELPDFAVYFDKDKYLGRALEKSGVRLFNRMSAIEACDDKALTALTLAERGILTVETVPAPLCYTQGVEPSEQFLQTVERLGYPLVAKKSYGSFGAGVELINGREELLLMEKKWLFLPHLYQRFVAESAGKDIRVVVVGGVAVAAMRRRAKDGEFRSNIELGGTGEKIELTKALSAAAERCAKALGLDYCGVDLLESKDGYAVCEVNSNAFFEGLEAATGVDIAAAYADYIVKEMQ